MIAAARNELRAMALRSNYLPARACRDPEWPMLAYLASLPDQTAGVTELSSASLAPQTTALRHIARLEREGLVERHKVDDDARVTKVSLTEAGWSAMSAYFERIAA